MRKKFQPPWPWNSLGGGGISLGKLEDVIFGDIKPNDVNN